MLTSLKNQVNAISEIVKFADWKDTLNIKVSKTNKYMKVHSEYKTQNGFKIQLTELYGYKIRVLKCNRLLDDLNFTTFNEQKLTEQICSLCELSFGEGREIVRSNMRVLVDLFEDMNT